jgi:hypothetical protein
MKEEPKGVHEIVFDNFNEGRVFKGVLRCANHWYVAVMVNLPVFLASIDDQNFIGANSSASERGNDLRQCMSGKLITGANTEAHRGWWQHDCLLVP